MTEKKKRRFTVVLIVAAVLFAAVLAGTAWIWLLPDRGFLWITAGTDEDLAFFARAFAKMFFSYVFLIPVALFAGALLWSVRLLLAGRGRQGIITSVTVLSALGIVLTFSPLLFSYVSCVTDLDAVQWQFVASAVLMALQWGVIPAVLLLLAVITLLLAVAFFARLGEKRRKSLTAREVIF